MNTHVRDNFNETGPAKATGAGGHLVTSAANTLIQRTASQALVDTQETTTSTTYTDLATSGPSVSVASGSLVLVVWSVQMDNSGAGNISYAGIDISGDTTSAAADSLALYYESSAAGDILRLGNAQFFSVTQGTSTYKVQYRVSAGTGTFRRRRIGVLPF